MDRDALIDEKKNDEEIINEEFLLAQKEKEEALVKAKIDPEVEEEPALPAVHWYVPSPPSCPQCLSGADPGLSWLCGLPVFRRSTNYSNLLIHH